MGGLVDNEQLLALMTSHQRRLTGFLRTLVANESDAEELLQETNLHLWRHAHEFELGTDFAAWALRIAHFRVLEWRKRQSRDRLVFDDTLVGLLVDAARVADGHANRRLEALRSCLKKLPLREHELITQLYGDESLTPQRLAERVGRSAKGIYESLNRIRMRLLECIRRELVAEENSQ